MQLEFEYLTVITGDPKYKNAVCFGGHFFM